MARRYVRAIRPKKPFKRGRSRRRAMRRFVSRTLHRMAEKKYTVQNTTNNLNPTLVAPTDSVNFVSWISIAQGDGRSNRDGIKCKL